ncbi:MAG: insulinase family protein [Bacteroidales bacterium]|nr:insulinase family protein [Bacteroidales bacterium]
MKNIFYKPLFTFLFLAVTRIATGQHIQFEEYKLDNGLTVILCEDHSRPEIFGAVAVKAGSKNDPADATGMAHYQEHMLFKGTEEIGTLDWQKEKPHIEEVFRLYDELGATIDPEKRNEIQSRINEESLKAAEYAVPNEFSNLIKSIGGTGMNAGTGPDMTIFHNTFPPNQVEKWLELYSHRFLNPVFRSFQAELEVVYEEKNMYYDNFFSPLFEEFNKNFFKVHPYGQQTLIGTSEDLKNPSLTKMYDFFKTYYVANNMALILSGDFKSDEIRPLIADKFGRLPQGIVPETQKYTEVPFNGRENVTKKMSPVRLALLGFRTPPENHPDKPVLDVCNNILSNENQSGLLDRLALDNRLLGAGVIPVPYNDYGCTIFIVVPKILGQKHEAAEQLVLAQIDSLRKGNFEDWMVESVKTGIYRDHMLSLESNDFRVSAFASAFSRGQSIGDFLSYPSRIKQVTKKDVMRVANEYYNDNYLAFFSGMGFPKKDKMEKPGYKPLTANSGKESEYARLFMDAKAAEPVFRFVDMSRDISIDTLRENFTLLTVANPMNDIFTFTIKSGIGEEGLPLLEYASTAINYAGAGGYDPEDLKKEFSRIGCTYSIYSDESYLYIELTGLDERLPDALVLLSKLLTEPNIPETAIHRVYEDEKAQRKLDQSDPRIIADALFEYAKFGNKSDYIRRIALKEVKKLNTDTLEKVFMKALHFQTEIHYCGTYLPRYVKEIINKYLELPAEFCESNSPVVTDPIAYPEKTVFFTPKKRARQSNIFFLLNGEPYDIREDAFINAFNMYFGGDFSGLVLQEIREYRSMAYSAYASYTTPPLPEKKTFFTGYIGTQTDKAIDAITVFDSLVYYMPEKQERTDLIRDYLKLSAMTGSPHFRDLSKKVTRWKLIGYHEDPAISWVEEYGDLAFGDILSFYQKNIQNRNLVICISGDRKGIDVKKLEKFGRISIIKEKQLFTK